jgi:hypothetical protein
MTIELRGAIGIILDIWKHSVPHLQKRTVIFIYCIFKKLALAQEMHCKAGEANTRLKTVSCEAGLGTTLIYSLEICIWSLLIQEFVDECCFPHFICDLLKCYMYKRICEALK